MRVFECVCVCMSVFVCVCGWPRPFPSKLARDFDPKELTREGLSRHLCLREMRICLFLGASARAAPRYSFIPDAGFVGTTFVNVTANLLATHSQNLTLHIRAPNLAAAPDQQDFAAAAAGSDASWYARDEGDYVIALTNHF
jgi:hypothetical protein